MLQQALKKGCRVDPRDVVYFVGHETVVRREDGLGMPEWQEILFAAMERNAVHVTDYFRLPIDGVVEIGREVAI
jgi:KUP system potassium uptake protein